ncbi:hypothetical protein Z046_00295 [Pseudomonas aeruginosa VRFPA09]|nr:hypothetical protein Z046_00295 [Pseudomonas aeruginosa VRFPA09]
MILAGHWPRPGPAVFQGGASWTGGITQAPAGYKPGQHHPDPFAADKPLFTIDKANLEQYREHLTPGQLALFKTYPDSFRMPVYPSRRSGSAPQWLYDNTFANATSARLLDGGNGFADAYGGVPFPIPKSGVEALWNHVARYRGTYVVRRASEVAVQRNGSYSLVTSQQEALFKYYLKGGSFADLNNLMFYYLSFTKSPARLAGGAVLVHETLDQVKEPRQAWGYNAGQRRVRRAPNLAYDTPIAAADGLRTADDTDMFNGAPDRYDWKLLGKKEIYIPYNNYKVSSPEVKYEELLKPGHLDPQYTRYELHRVWVVEGTLKPGARHIYSKRTLYLDEDSWSAAVVDQYDGRGELWRVSMAYLKNFYDLPYTWSPVLEGAADALALGFAQPAGQQQQQQAAAALGALFQQVEGLAHRKVGALAGLGHDRRFQGVEQVARGELVVRQRHQGMRAAGVDDDRGLRVVARAKQVEQLAPGLFQAGRRQVAGKHPGSQLEDRHQRVATLHRGLFQLLPTGPEQGQQGQQPGDTEADPGHAVLPPGAADQQPGLEGRRQQQLPASGTTLAMQQLPQQPAKQRRQQQPVGAQPVRPGVQQQVHGCLPERRRGQVRFSRGQSSSATSSTLRPRAAASGQLYSARAGRARVVCWATGSRRSRVAEMLSSSALDRARKYSPPVLSAIPRRVGSSRSSPGLKPNRPGTPPCCGSAPTPIV